MIDENMKKYLELDKQIKELQEEQQLYKESIELWLKENNKEKYKNSYGQVTMKEVKGAKRLNKALAEQHLNEEQLQAIMKESASSVRLTIMSTEAIEARNRFLEKKTEE